MIKIIIGATLLSFGIMYFSQALGMLVATIASDYSLVNEPIMIVKELVGVIFLSRGFVLLSVTREDT